MARTPKNTAAQETPEEKAERQKKARAAKKAADRAAEAERKAYAALSNGAVYAYVSAAEEAAHAYSTALKDREENSLPSDYVFSDDITVGENRRKIEEFNAALAAAVKKAEDDADAACAALRGAAAAYISAACGISAEKGRTAAEFAGKNAPLLSSAALRSGRYGEDGGCFSGEDRDSVFAGAEADAQCFLSYTEDVARLIAAVTGKD